MWYIINAIWNTCWYYLGYKEKPPVHAHVNSDENIEWYKNYQDPLWCNMMKRAQKIMFDNEMDPIEYMDRINIDRAHALALFDHRLRPWQNTRLIMNFYKYPDMNLKIIKDKKYIGDLINYIYTDIINEFGIISIYIDSQLHIIVNDKFTTNEPLIKLIKSLSDIDINIPVVYKVQNKIEIDAS